MRILIVDDEEGLLNSFKRMLHSKKDKWDIVTELSSQNAVEMMKKESFDVLITDVLMKNVDGFALLKAAKEINPTAYVLMMTGAGTIKDAVEAMRLGAWDYIIKPLNNDELIMKLEHLDSLINVKGHIEEVEQEIQDMESAASNEVVNLQFQLSEHESKLLAIQRIVESNDSSEEKILKIKAIF